MREYEYTEQSLLEGSYVLPITVAARSKPWAVFARSNIGIVGSNPTRGMDVCIVCFYSVFVFFCA
jgi:hypothetical protein